MPCTPRANTTTACGHIYTHARARTHMRTPAHTRGHVQTGMRVEPWEGGRVVFLFLKENMHVDLEPCMRDELRGHEHACCHTVGKSRVTNTCRVCELRMR